jgi:hypothetical protein
MSKAFQMNCKEVSGLLVFYACGETNEQETKQIEVHLASCAACAGQLAEERSFHESLIEALQASDRFDADGILLSQCRSELAEALDDMAAPAPEEPVRPMGWVRRWMVLRPVLSGASLVLFGIMLGTEVMPWVSARIEPNADVQALNVSPAMRLTDDQLSKMAVGAINILPASAGTPGTLQLHVKTEEPMVLSGSVDDPDLRRVLTYVVENGEQSEPGVRLDCLEALRARTSDQDVRRALLYAARKDQNPAVRMKALESLRGSVADLSVRETLIDALEHDANAGVRVEAVNMLVQSLEANAPTAIVTTEPTIAPGNFGRPFDASMQEVVRALEDLQRNDPNRYVRLRSATALRELGPRETQ